MKRPPEDRETDHDQSGSAAAFPDLEIPFTRSASSVVAQLRERVRQDQPSRAVLSAGLKGSISTMEKVDAVLRDATPPADPTNDQLLGDYIHPMPFDDPGIPEWVKTAVANESYYSYLLLQQVGYVVPLSGDGGNYSTPGSNVLFQALLDACTDTTLPSQAWHNFSEWRDRDLRSRVANVVQTASENVHAAVMALPPDITDEWRSPVRVAVVTVWGLLSTPELRESLTAVATLMQFEGKLSKEDGAVSRRIDDWFRQMAQRLTIAAKKSVNENGVDFRKYTATRIATVIASVVWNVGTRAGLQKIKKLSKGDIRQG